MYTRPLSLSFSLCMCTVCMDSNACFIPFSAPTSLYSHTALYNLCSLHAHCSYTHTYSIQILEHTEKICFLGQISEYCFYLWLFLAHSRLYYSQRAKSIYNVIIIYTIFFHHLVVDFFSRFHSAYNCKILLVLFYVSCGLESGRQCTHSIALVHTANTHTHTHTTKLP